MNTINPYLRQYQKNQVETATPEQILILLYDGAIQFLNKAKIALDDENSEQYQSNLLSCEKIIIEFMNTLDMEKGGEVAQNLYRLYEYFYTTLITVAISREVNKIDEVLRHLKDLRETWQKAIAIANSEKDAHLHETSDENAQSSGSYEYLSSDNGEDSYERYDSEDDDDDYDDEEEDDDELENEYSDEDSIITNKG